MVRFEFDSFQFEADSQVLRRAGELVPLAPKAAVLLLAFLERPATLLSQDELRLKCWSDVNVVDGNLSFQLSILKRALGQRPKDEKFIKTLSKRGYMFVVPVKRISTNQEETTASNETPLLAGPENRSGVAGPYEIHPPHAKRLSSRQLATAAIIGVVLSLSLATMLAYRSAQVPSISVTFYTPLTSDRIEKVEGPLLTDGVRVFFRERNPNGNSFAAVSINGGATGQISLPTNVAEVFDLRPLTSEVLAGSRTLDPEVNDLWVVPLLGGSARKIENVRVNGAQWSPNGKQLALTKYRELYVANGDGTGLRKIAEVPGGAFSPRWSPDGRSLRFSVRSLESIDNQLWGAIWEVQADGSNLHQLLVGWNNPPHECCGVWTSDGSYYIFQSTRDGRTDLWALSERRLAFGRNAELPIRLTSGIEGYFSPGASTDRMQVFAIGAEKRGELVRYDLNQREFVPFLGGIDATWVTFSKSGKNVAYIQRSDRTVWRAKSDGSGKSQITFSPFEADGLSWSPDDRWFAYRGRIPGKPWNIYVVPSGGGEAKALIPSGTEQAIPAWSGDGKRIAFGDVPLIHGKPTGTEAIHIFDLSHGTVSKLPGTQGLWTARWSPDGRFLSALTIQSQRLMFYEFKTHKWRPTQADNVNNPTWSRDGKYVYFDTEGHTRSLRRVSLANGRVDELFNLSAYPDLAWWWSGVAPDNSPLILRNIGSSQIYSLSLESR